MCIILRQVCRYVGRQIELLYKCSHLLFINAMPRLYCCMVAAQFVSVAACVISGAL